MIKKNHDYGEAWRDMRVSSYTDLILTKIERIKEIEDLGGATLVSEGIDANYMDIMKLRCFWSKSNYMNKIKSILVNLSRTLLALTFIFSGFVKAIDPLGSQYKIAEYLEAVQLSAYIPDWAQLILSVGYQQ